MSLASQMGRGGGLPDSQKRGQLVLFPFHLARRPSHLWRFAGLTKLSESLFYCAHCELVKVERSDGSKTFGLTDSKQEPRCKGAA